MSKVLVLREEGLAGGLKDADFEVIEATDSSDGLRLVLDGAPDIIIMNEDMPPIDGAEFLPVLKDLTKAPIIVIGSGEEMAMVQALLQGADTYLIRPVSIRELIARIGAFSRRYALS